MGGDHRNPPYEFIENGKPAGFNIELMQAAAEVLGLDLEIRLGPWNEARRDLEEGKIDLLTGMYYSAERSRLVDFSVPHTMVSPGLFVRQGSDIRSIKDLAGREIIVQDEDVIHDLLKQTGLASRIIALTDPDAVLRLLASGRHDCALVPSRLQGELFIQKYGLTNLKAVNEDLSPFKYCFAAGKGKRELLSRLDEGLNILKATGRYQQIYEKWFGVYEKRDIWRTSKYIIAALTLIAAFFAASLLWSRSLKKQVEFQTSELRKSEEKLREAHGELESRVEERTEELKTVNERLRNSELEKSLILNSSTELITFQDLDMRIRWANQNAADELDMTASELVGRHCYELRHQLNEPCSGCPVVLAGKTGLPQQAEMPAVNADRTVFIRGYPVKNGRSELIGMAEFVLDVTERRKAEEALKASEARYRAVVDAFDGMIYICSHDYHIKFMNKKMIERTGYDATGELCYKVLHDLDSKCAWCVNERVRKGETIRWELQSPKDNRWYYVINTPINSADGTISKQAMIFDITDRKKNEEELRKYREGLERLVEERTLKLKQANMELEASREQLRSLYAHKQSLIEQQRTEIAREIHDELGQMLTVLKMDLVWIKDRLPVNQKDLADKIQTDIRVTDETIRSIKRICTELRPGILDMLGLAAAIDWKSADFQERTGIRCSAEIESDTIDLDKDRRIAVFRIFQEALTNVLRHSKATEITVRLRAEDGRAILEVSDNGIGITAEQLARPGSFGLLGMRERVYPWGGEVTISGIPNNGTTVRVSIPVS